MASVVVDRGKARVAYVGVLARREDLVEARPQPGDLAPEAKHTAQVNSGIVSRLISLLFGDVCVA